MGKPYCHINSKHSVCMNCGDRRIGCHGKCKEYQDEVKANEENKQRINKDKIVKDAVFYNAAKRGKVNLRKISKAKDFKN